MKSRTKQYLTSVLLTEPATREINRKGSISFPNRGSKMETSNENFVMEDY